MATANPHRENRGWLARFYLAFCTERFTSELVWPAAAGNVFWSALTLAIDYDVKEEAGDAWGARMTLLLVLSGYLTFTWQRERIVLKTAAAPDDRKAPKKDTVKFWAFDHFHIFCIVVVAIMAATVAPLPWVWGWLLALFGVTTLGHALGVWESYRDSVFCKAAANFLGVVFILVVLPPDWEWGPVVTTLIVLGLWGVIVADEHRKSPYLTDRLGNAWRGREERRKQKAEEHRRQEAAKASTAGDGQSRREAAVSATADPMKKDEQGDRPPSAPA